jgi:hypothetical protein
MALDIPSAESIEPGKAETTTLWNQVRDSLLFLSGAVGGSLANDIFNGDFELDSDTDGVPDFWSKTDNHGTTYPGGTVAFETTSPISGAQSMKFVHPGGAGNGGGLLESDYYECSENASFKLSWIHYSSAAGMKNQVIVYWYDKDQVALGGTPSTTIYSSTANPTSAKEFSGICNPPSGAKYYTIGLVGGFTDTDVAGTAYFDSVTRERLRTRVYEITSSTASLDILDLRDSKLIEIIGIDLVGSAAGNTNLGVTVSADNGATFITTSTYYIANKGATSSSGTTAYSAFGSTTSAYNANFNLKIYSLGQAKRTIFESENTGMTSASVGIGNSKHGGESGSTAYNAVQLLFGLNNLASGTIIVNEVL